MIILADNDCGLCLELDRAGNVVLQFVGVSTEEGRIVEVGIDDAIQWFRLQLANLEAEAAKRKVGA
ncbi:hypothetical protein EBT16_15045 [bacterium]|nr:hypothetical protein [bacterium]